MAARSRDAAVVSPASCNSSAFLPLSLQREHARSSTLVQCLKDADRARCFRWDWGCVGWFGTGRKGEELTRAVAKNGCETTHYVTNPASAWVSQCHTCGIWIPHLWGESGHKCGRCERGLQSQNRCSDSSPP